MNDTDPYELLSALLDREPVDPDRLAALLDRPEARALLVDFVRLRATLVDAEPAPAVTLGAGRRPPTWRSAMIRVAAAVLLVAAGGVAGTWIASRAQDRPPEPSRVVRLIPAGGAEGGTR